MLRFRRALTCIAATTLAVSAISFTAPVLGHAAADPSTVLANEAVALSRTPTPDPVALLQDFTNYWKPDTYDTTNEAATAYHGTVVNPTVLAKNDALAVAINNRGATDLDQARRALIDADKNWIETFPDALGPVLGQYLEQGLSTNSLPDTTLAIAAANLGVGSAKTFYNYAHPYTVDRSRAGAVALDGLQPTLNIDRVPDWNGHTAPYASTSTYTLSFPSDHTTYAYSTGVALAQLIPQLGPEILTRASEAGNNRIVLGVHYPLDIMGGRIIGEANNSYLWSDTTNVSTVLQPAEAELQGYLTQRCSADGHGSTLAACIANTDANGAHGYTNYFTDAVSGSAVTDRSSALSAYRARMTYGFTQTGTAGQAAVVPDGAESLLATAFPTLTAVQRRAVLAATEIDSGYPLDSSSGGWQRIDLAAAMSSKVTVDSVGNVTDVEPGQAVASVVSASPSPSPSVSSSGSPSASESGSPSASESGSPSASESGSPSASVTNTPSASESATGSATPSVSASESATESSSSSASSAAVAAGVPSATSTRAASVLGLPVTGASGAEGLIGLAVVLSAGVGGLFAARKIHRH